jgi:hypothetical protein
MMLKEDDHLWKTKCMQLIEKILNENYIHIIDDFYPDLEWVKQHIKDHPFQVVGNVNYVGSISSPPANKEITCKRLESLLACKLSFSETDGKVRSMTEPDQKNSKTFIHFDPDRLNIIVYLNDLPNNVSAEEAGTFFYKHKKMRQKKFISLKTLKDDLQKSIAYEDTNVLEAWDEWHNVAYKKNRAIIFNGNLYHSPGKKFFGTNIETSRLTQNFFPKVLAYE